VEIRSLGYRTDLMIRVLEGSQVDDRGDYLVVSTPKNPDYWWGNFLLLASPPSRGQAKRWVTTFKTEFPQAEHVALGIDVTEASQVDINGMVAAGLALDRNAVLTARDLIEPPQPNTVATYRELAGDDDWRQALELRLLVTEAIPGGTEEFVRYRIAAERGLTEAGYGSWYGAFLDGQLVAQLGIVPGDTGAARYQNVETHPAHRRTGLAGTLVWEAGSRTLADGFTSTLVMVADPKDVAIRVYRSVGFADAEAMLGFQRAPSRSAPAVSR
jgi:GNAT superfamily N-acetyltransferase